MNFKSLYQKPLQAFKWVITTIRNFVDWNRKQIVAFVKGTWNLIVAIAKWGAGRVEALGRFWIGIVIMTTGAKMASENIDAVVKFLSGQITEGNFTFGLFLIAIGLICVIYSADYSKFRLWGSK